MRIGGTSGVGIGSGGAYGLPARFRVEPGRAADTSGERPQAEPNPSASRALVPVEPTRAEPAATRLVRHAAHAPFIAQLIATRDDLPETRRLRRAPAALAARIYGTAMDRPELLPAGWMVDERL